jgi:hypothetical protein
LPGTGKKGRADGVAGAATFYEPGGLAATSDALYVADTNNHAVRRIALDNGQVTTLAFSGIGGRMSRRLGAPHARLACSFWRRRSPPRPRQLRDGVGLKAGGPSSNLEIVQSRHDT